MQKLVRDGHAELVPSEQLGRDDGAVWYLPHHSVLSGATSKLRIVFECAAKYQGFSLNNECFQGPDLCNKLFRCAPTVQIVSEHNDGKYSGHVLAGTYT